MEIRRNGSRPAAPGPARSFSGSVRREAILDAAQPSRLAAGFVTFEPGARTHWHTHPVGQLLIVTGGCGRVGTCGGPVEEVRAGDTIWFGPGEKHWHGAGPDTGMTHVAVTEAENGSAVDWMEPVTEKEFAGG
ncbi:cupin domain-containing protein [Poseidonocella sp. HB161398]|uniref:(R)-mandelonitrile lyase n=1 Tax=Poseidonocella sp. HB161398 TaxID=2320855 RepID=UPI001108AC23|nr:cupin domain-containing protein [Poseidonocella sp. HB161398]